MTYENATLTYGPYTVQFTVSNPHRSKYASPEFRYVITDPTDNKHQSRLAGSGIGCALNASITDIEAHVERLEENEKALALTVESSDASYE